MDIQKMNLPLPSALHAAVFREARRRGTPATRLVREIISQWLAEQERTTRAEEIRRFATAHAGSDADLDRELESAGLEILSEDGERAQG